MDPYIEMDEWSDFHTNLIVEIERKLLPLLLPKYVARAQRRIYLETSLEEPIQRISDIHLSQVGTGIPVPGIATAVATEVEPETYTAPMPIEQIEPFLEIRDREDQRVVSVIEVLSPTNKRRGSDGFHEYAEKRIELLQRRVNLVELDLLRAGARPATIEPLRPTTDYCVMVHRWRKRPAISVYQWGLRQPLPRIPIPLDPVDPEVQLDLGQILNKLYDELSLRQTLHYGRPLIPPPRSEDQAWVANILQSFSVASTEAAKP